MDQFFHISSQWRVAVCIRRQHAVWLDKVAGHLRGFPHRFPAKEASRMKREVSEAPMIQDPADFESIQTLDEPIPELKVCYDAWTYTAAENCHCTALAMGTLKNHCAKQRGMRTRSKYRVQEAHHQPWVRVKGHWSEHDSNYFRIGSLESATNDPVPTNAIATAKEQIRDAQRGPKQRTLQETEDRQEGTEFVP